MSENQHNSSRRRFMRNALAGAAAIPVASLVFNRNALADADRVSEDDPIAVALHYKHDVADVTHDAYQEGQVCANCALYVDSGGDWGPCAAFANRHVAAQGWCTAWVSKG